MSKAKRVRARRQSAPKQRATKKRSEIIKNCVIYLQSIAAFKAGFDADDDDLEIAGGYTGSPGREAQDRADRALSNLTRMISSANATDKPLSFFEMRSTAVTLGALIKYEAENEISGDALEFIDSFARHLVSYFKSVTDAARKQKNDQPAS
jgi:hypothetical protein